MTLTVTEYRHDDAGAPALDGSIGSLIGLLKACLVDGYGDKDPAGWTRPLSETGRAAFVNNTGDGGTGCYVYVEDDGSSSEGARSANIRTYTTMQDLDTGDYGTNLVWCRKSNTEDSTARPWILWADGLTFWLYVVDSGDSVPDHGFSGMLGAGDYDCLDADNAYRFFALGRALDDETGDSRWASIDSSDHAGFEVVHLDGITGPVTGFIAQKSMARRSDTGNCGTFAPAPGSVGQAALVPADFGVYESHPLGRLRGVAYPFHSLDAFTNAEEIANTGYTLTRVNVGGNISGADRVGSLPVKISGAW